MRGTKKMRSREKEDIVCNTDILARPINQYLTIVRISIYLSYISREAVCPQNIVRGKKLIVQK